jgi:hypothetical protein
MRPRLRYSRNVEDLERSPWKYHSLTALRNFVLTEPAHIHSFLGNKTPAAPLLQPRCRLVTDGGSAGVAPTPAGKKSNSLFLVRAFVSYTIH